MNIKAILLFRSTILIFTLFFFILSAPASSAGQTTSLHPVQLFCEYTVNPVGVENPHPQLSWILESPLYNTKQSAYQVLVASNQDRLSPKAADLWNSGIVGTGQSAHIAYSGTPLQSRGIYYWQVRVWDENHIACSWSKPAVWQMGLLAAGEWQAHWIGSGPSVEPRPADGFFKHTKEQSAFSDTVHMEGRSTLLRKTFSAKKTIRRAQVYVCGLGYYELHCNGRRVGDLVLAPAKTNYAKWILYDIYDLTDFLHKGENALGLELGNGWFNPYKKWWDPYRMQWFGSKRALLQLHIDYRDGSSEVIITDQTWKTTPGPILYSCIYDGETYDATQEQKGWHQPRFDDSRWSFANLVESPGGALVHTLMPAIKVTQYIHPIALTHPKTGVVIYDLGQNFNGWIRLRCHGPRGSRIVLRYAEDLGPDGTLDVTSNEKAAATDVYILKGEEEEIYEPRFTFHGFRFAEVTGLSYIPKKNDLTGCVVHTAADTISSFTCSNELVNRIHRATLWSQRSNLMGYPMDCPQRDERLGWFGDAMVTAEEAMINFDTANFYRHWLDGIRRNQNKADGDISIISPRPYVTDEPDPTWSSAYLVITWQFFLQYGDLHFLQTHYGAMKQYVDYLTSRACDYLLPKYWIGDWGTIVPGWQEGDPPSICSEFYHYNASIVARAAAVLGKKEDAEQYVALAENIRRAVNKKFYDAEKRQYDFAQTSQFANALPLILGIAEPQEVSGIMQNILIDLQRHNNHLTVGVLGAKYLIDALTRFGHAEKAYELVNQTGYPSWAHMLEGRTTLSEFWDLKGSHNHVMMGSIDSWFYTTLAGIQIDTAHPGYEHILIKPFFAPGLTFVKAQVRTLRGPIAVSWQKEAKAMCLQVSIPSNTTATVFITLDKPEQLRTKPAVAPAHFQAGQAVLSIGSGNWTFRTGEE